MEPAFAPGVERPIAHSLEMYCMTDVDASRRTFVAALGVRLPSLMREKELM
jgi:hypothetical protein